MGWKSKLLFLMIIYFSGFGTAVYYLAPPGENNARGQGIARNTQSSIAGNSESAGKAMDVLNKLGSSAYSKVAASISGMNQQEFKAAYERGLQAIKNMSKTGPNPVEGTEEK